MKIYILIVDDSKFMNNSLEASLSHQSHNIVQAFDIATAKELIKNYADLNFREEKTGFTPIMMACHLNTEPDALKIVQLLCDHRYFKG